MTETKTRTTKRVLFVDDERPIRDAFERTFKHADFGVDVAASGAGALALAAQNRYDLVLTDLKMPGLDGLAMIQRYKQMHPTTPFVVITGLRRNALTEQCGAEPNIVALVRKPWAPDELDQIIHDILSTGRNSVTSTIPPTLRAPLRTLVIGELAAITSRLQSDARYELMWAAPGPSVVRALEANRVDVAIVDYDGADNDSLDALEALDPSVALIAVCPTSNRAHAIRAIRSGAQDCLSSDGLEDTELHRAIQFSVERKRTERRLLHAATHDPLTGLANRNLLLERMQRAVSRSSYMRRQFAVVIVDIDNFRELNLRFGHDTGDVLLSEMANRLSKLALHGDSVARVGADEFAILVESFQGMPKLMTFIDEVRRALSRPSPIYDVDVEASACMGIAVFPEAGQTADTMLKAAELALNEAKSEGANVYYVYGEATGQAIRKRMDLESALRKAAQQEEFIFHFQPQIDLQSGRIVGAEALVRWQRATGSLVSPGEFVPILEETGLIVPVGNQAMREACNALRMWNHAGHDMNFVSVNVSPRQFEGDELLPGVELALARSALAAHQLELEITEGLLMADPDRAARILRQLSDLGVRIAIDDFGTGYSSLAYLHRFPVNTLKIDRSFVMNLGRDSQSDSIVGSIIVLAHKLQLSVVAEGVETAQQRDFLRREGCELAQGFLFARPVPWQDVFAAADATASVKEAR